MRVLAVVGTAVLVLVGVCTCMPANNDPVPFMCAHDTSSKAAEAFVTQALVQVGCGQSDNSSDCTPKYTLSATGSRVPFNATNWTAPASPHPAMSCAVCDWVLANLNGFCADNSGRTQDVVMDFVEHCVRTRGDPSIGWMCLRAYRAVAELYCPLDPCVNLRTALQAAPHALCASAALSCEPVDPVVDFPPEQPMYPPFAFRPPSKIPPLSCVEYSRMVHALCAEDLVPQYAMCDKLDGRKREGCLAFIKHTLSHLDPTDTGDICYVLYHAVGAAYSPAAASAMCTAMGVRDQSPFPLPTPVPVETPEPTPTPMPTPTPTPTPTPQPPCVDNPTPTPVPRGITHLFGTPPGFRTNITDAKRIEFSCDSTTYWAGISPHVGCHFSPFNLRLAGFPDPSADFYKCQCEASGHNPKHLEGSKVYWSDVSSATDCAQMMCSKPHHFRTCSWEGLVVARDGAWNGENVRFTSDALQDTCEGGTGQVSDVCGTVVTVGSSSVVGRAAHWKIVTSSGATIASSTLAPDSAEWESHVSVGGVWLPCDDYTVELTDRSFEGGAWTNASLVLTDAKGFVIARVAGDDGHAFARTLPLTINSGVIAQSRQGLCTDCAGDPMPCKIAVRDAPSLCVPFLPTTTECPAGFTKCD